jgi:RNA polymerase-binding transcription factor DksA
MAELGSDNWEQELTYGLIESKQSLLREIEEALERLRNGTYGICEATKKRITKVRLRAIPWARYCIEHARTLEAGLA